MCDRLAERERVILVSIFVVIRYVKYPVVFKKHVPGTRYV